MIQHWFYRFAYTQVQMGACYGHIAPEQNQIPGICLISVMSRTCTGREHLPSNQVTVCVSSFTIHFVGASILEQNLLKKWST
ncbi:hypothetical protein CDL12_21119 [Handroanthus impetiginosus]|uniref:Uncharacterized protein n=1 Tax=Handroanthus impetiginosus TaxID=429701 RepID=A0A2G9GM31_9LAMI|nr:hypothetical protein CDL12_21119 [Handroanthus impetiginosus]